MAACESDRAARWESRYQANDLPWDSSDVEPELIRRLDEIGLAPLPRGGAGGGGVRASATVTPPHPTSPQGGGAESPLPGREGLGEGGSSGLANARRAIDLGCGTGINAIALAQRGFDVYACDISPKAIELAKARAAAAGCESITFDVVDVLDGWPIDDGSVDFVFDRGCFHSVHGDERDVFARRVADALKAGGWWVSLMGNKDDDPKFDQPGPPQVSATQITNIVESLFEVHDLRRIRFTDNGQPTHLAWSALLRKR